MSGTTFAPFLFAWKFEKNAITFNEERNGSDE
jgi:hypothetical protein